MGNNRSKVTDLEKLIKGGRKKFVRYEEGAMLYSMGKVTENMVFAGETALSEKTMLNPSRVVTYAISENGWLDDKNRAYIIYTIDNIMDDLGCSKPTCIKIIKELDSDSGIGLIEKVRRGLGKFIEFYGKSR